MRRHTIVLGALILLVLALQSPAQASDNWYGGIQLGPEFLTDDHDGAIDDAFAFGAYGGYRFDRQLSLEASLLTANHDAPGHYDVNITSVLFGPRLSAPVNKNLILYGGVGLGLYFIDPDYDSSDTDLGLYFGGGMEFPIQSNLRLGLDFKYHATFDDDTIDSDLLTLLFRVGF